MKIGIDIGGTFTDIVASRGGKIAALVKLPSTPEDYSRAIAEGISRLLRETGAAAADVHTVVHGTTVATNAILEGRGARTALLTTRGFRDVLELRRIRTPELYNLGYEKPPALVPRRHCLEIGERLGAGGEVLQPVEEADVEAAIEHCRQARIEAVAICFLHSYRNDAHERHVAQLTRAGLGPDVFVTASHEILPEIREYERTSTTVVNAYIGPVVRQYLQRIRGVLHDLGIEAPLRIMQSNGGTLGLEAVLRTPAAIIESGPAAGVVAGAEIARTVASGDAITIDMGGTTAKASLIENGEIGRTSDYEVGAGINVSSQLVKGRGHALRLPVIDISEIGAGGGSLAVLDASGRLLVGPESAGAVPGPVGYGKGGDVPTLTDAMIVLGYVNGTSIAGGTVPIDAKGAQRALEDRIAAPLGIGADEAAYGVYRIAGSIMTRAVKAVTTMRGRDPRNCALIAFGGNGSLMAPFIADDLQIRMIYVPPMPGVFSACGLLIAPNEHQLVRTLFCELAAMVPGELSGALSELARKASEELVEDGARPESVETQWYADIRYKGQAYELTIPVAPDIPDERIISALAADFHAEHERTFGHASPRERVDLVSIRANAREVTGNGSDLRFSSVETASAASSRTAYFANLGRVETDVISRADLRKRGETRGPLIVEEDDSTTVVPPGWTARLDHSANIVVERSA